MEKYKTLGCFCSYNCALSYNLLNSVNDKNERTCLLHQLYKQKINEYKPIKPAPPKEILTIYGGNVTIENIKKISNKYCDIFCTSTTINIDYSSS